MVTDGSRNGSRVALAVVLALGTPVGALAQEASTGGLEEFVVTAQRREQSMQDVATSLWVLRSDTIRQLGITDMTAVVAQTPGMQIIQFSPVVTQLSIRGVSQASFADHLEGPVALYIDEAYVAANGAVAGSLFDIDRIEVLRGPQGTLFGRNATGGLVHYVTNRPTDYFDGYMQLTGADYGEFNVQGAFGGPLVGDLNGRFAYSYTTADGHLPDSGQNPDTPGQDNYFLRGQLATSIGAEGEASLSLRYARNRNEAVDAYVSREAFMDADGLGRFVNPNQSLPTRRATDGPHDFNRTVRGGTLRLTLPFDPATFHSITDYYELAKTYAEDTDASLVPLFVFKTDQRLNQFSQEFRLDGSADKLRWVTGLYFLELDSENMGRVPIPIAGLDFQADWDQDTSSQAVFAQVEYDFAPRWTATLGGRYSMDQKDISLTQRDNVTGDVLFVYDPSTFGGADRNFDGFSGKAELAFRPVDDVMTYASVNRGYKGGNWNTPVFPTFDATTYPHDSEKLTSYEIGVKSTLAQGRVRLNADAFYYDYDDYQAFFFEDAVSALRNRDATLKGGEIEVTAMPVDGLTLQLGYAGIHSEVKDVSLPGGRVVDREMPLAPRTSLNALVRYEWAALDGKVALQGDGRYDSEMYYTTNNAEVEQQPSRFVGNVRASYGREIRGADVELALFVRNVTDEIYAVYGADLASFGFAGYTLAPPRVYGATLTVQF
jgi:iron complex outermembrane recepter protein